ncbi:hypothetical protein BSZ21_21955 [Bradyrhizobium canariense]|uniref:hypothetical protein n=1 Tax=Bradyrhizobium canariense TaxID=255045 RepID=UPI000A192562|nr:hypothetical protein [Bradyrhizobium canariense]OSI65047.1 hypothetical protein BSZ21_21955 [Bradyrhizobium canariense]
MRVSRLRGRPDLFVSAKCPAPIPARHPALRAALVRASLDPAVRAVSHVATAHVGSAQVEIDAAVVEVGGRRFHLDVVPARRGRDVEEERLFRVVMARLGLPPLVVTAEALDAEPMRSNRDLVWSHNRRFVPVGLRIRILQVLRDDGPMELVGLLENVRSDVDPTPSVMSLACDDLLELDLQSGPLGPSTTVRQRA